MSPLVNLHTKERRRAKGQVEIISTQAEVIPTQAELISTQVEVDSDSDRNRGGRFRLGVEISSTQVGVESKSDCQISTPSRDWVERFRLRLKFLRLRSESSRNRIPGFLESRLGVDISSTQVEDESKSDFQTSTPSRDWAENSDLGFLDFRLESKSKTPKS